MANFLVTLGLLRGGYKTYIEVFPSLWFLKLCVKNGKTGQLVFILENKEIVDTTVALSQKVCIF